MTNNADYQEALLRIEREVERRSGKLNLVGLDIDELPKQLSRASHLHSLNCAHTSIKSLDGIEACPELTSLNCQYTAISDLLALQNCREISFIDCDGCHLVEPCEWLWERPPLREFYIHQGSLESVPQELLSTGSYNNCADRLRDYFRSTRAGTVATRTVKLFLLGNGSVGKTQLSRMIRNLPYEDNCITTHGIDISRLTLADSDFPIHLNLWDFGGQPLYHGTHALFLRNRAIFLLAWSPAHENGAHIDSFGIEHDNHPLEFWLDYARGAAGQESAALIVETQCDDGKRRSLHPPVSDVRLQDFTVAAPLAVSAKDGLGRDELMLALTKAAGRILKNSRYTEISVLWADVIEEIARLRPDDSSVPVRERMSPSPPADGKARTIDRPAFVDLCRRCGLDFGYDTLLHYLDAVGEIFYRPGRFNDDIIIDQNWALQAIYTLLERNDCVDRLRRAHGRFTADDLGLWLWNKQGHTPKTQALFISFMLSCGLAFEHYRVKGIPHFIAPSALPTFENLALHTKLAWRDDWACKRSELPLDFLHEGITQGLIAKVGGVLGPEADYWRGGVQLYHRVVPCIARLFVEQGQGIAGQIIVEIRYPQSDRDDDAAAIAGELRSAIDEHFQTIGMSRGPWTIDAGDIDKLVSESSDEDKKIQKILESNPTSVRRALIDEAFEKIDPLNAVKLDRLMVRLGIPVNQRPGTTTAEEKATYIVDWSEQYHRLDELIDLLSSSGSAKCR